MFIDNGKLMHIKVAKNDKQGQQSNHNNTYIKKGNNGPGRKSSI